MSEMPADEPQDEIHEPQEDPEEVQARKRGWVDEDTWNSNPDNEGKPHFTAREFNERGNFIDQITSLRDELESVRQGQRELIEQDRAAAKAEFDRRLNERMAQAVAAGDGAAAQKVMEEARQPQEQGPDPEVQRWISGLPWYGVDQRATQYAQFLDQQLAGQFGDTISMAEHLRRVEEGVKDMFPNLGENPNRQRAASTEAGGRRREPVRQTRVPKLSDLPDEFQKAGRMFVRQGLFKTNEEYVKSLIDDGVIDAG